MSRASSAAAAAASSSCCACTFMKHDKWANVLFLHWAVPPHLESSLLPSPRPQFELDRMPSPDGRAWIGLILLTEQNVGPSIGRCNRVLVTHHGVNVRTYVKGVKKKNKDEGYSKELRGIYFASLECDDFITSWGANWFGMPYRIASIERRFGIPDEDDTPTGTSENDADEEYKALIKQNAMSSNEIDDIMCQNESTYIRTKTFSLKSVRSRAGEVPSIWSPDDGAAHSTKLEFINDTSSSPPREQSGTGKNGASPDSYSVECTWERRPGEDKLLSDNDKAMADFFVERYHVYTRTYGLNWRGTVTHREWPVERAILTKLAISNIDCYEPIAMQPLIRHMAETEPESVLFSPGVGPIDFHMLRPV